MLKMFFKCAACMAYFERTEPVLLHTADCPRCGASVAPYQADTVPRAAYSVSVSHIDTCLPCYLQDGHTRPGELLLQVAIDGGTTVKQVLDTLLFDLRVLDWNETLESHQSEALESAIQAEIESEFGKLDADSVFDDSLDAPPSEESDSHEYDEAEQTVRDSFGIQDMDADDSDEAELNARIVEARCEARDKVVADWEKLQDMGESVYAYFLITYEERDIDEADSEFAREVLARVRFHVSSETVTHESAENGEAESSEMLTCDNGVSLREAVKLLGGVGSADEISSSPMHAGDWFTNTQYDFDYSRGAQESRSLHPFKTITPSSQIRLARIVHHGYRRRALEAVRKSSTT